MENTLIEVACQKSVSGDQFAQGNSDFNFTIGAPSAWIPSESFFRFAISVTDGGGSQPFLNGGDIALAENFISSLYSQCTFRAGGQEVSSLVRYVPQADQLKMRLDKSYSWQKSIGKNVFFIESDYDQRKKMTGFPDESITSTGTISIDSEGIVLGSGGTTFKTSGVKFGDQLIVISGGTQYKYLISSVSTNSVASVAVAPGLPITAGASYSIKRDMETTGTSDYRNKIYVLWKPPIGIFDYQQPLGAGNYMISLNPFSSYKTAAVQSIESALPLTAFNFTVDDVRLYVSTLKMEIPDKVEELVLREMDIQSKVIDGNVSSLQFTIPPSTYAISLFLQAGQAGYNTLAPPTLFKTLLNPDDPTAPDERSLTNVQITYAGISKPSVNWSNNEYTFLVNGNTATNQLQQRYFDTFREAGVAYREGGVESYEDYLDRGLLLHWSYVKDTNNKATEVQLSAKFNAALPANTRLFLVAHFTKIVEMTSVGGNIVEIRSRNA